MLRFILPSLVWTALVIILSLVPSSNIGLNEMQFKGVDKAAHFIIYASLTLLWTIALKRQNVFVGLRKNAFRITVFGGFALSFAIELLQEYVISTRHFEFLDLIANGIGCIFGLILFKMIYKNAYK